MWKAVKTSTREVGMGEAERRRGKRGKREEKGREREKEESKEGEDSGS